MRLSSIPSRVFTALACVALSWAPAVARADDDALVASVELEGGRHWKIVTSSGTVHVWRPDGYDRATAGTVLYVHGYYTDVDGAWDEHRLARQFADSGRNALFVACEAPSGNEASVVWHDLGELLVEVTARTGLALPDGPIVAAGHSGAIRTIVEWLPFSRLDEVLLLDAMYAGEEHLHAWLTKNRRHEEKKLVLVGGETTDRSQRFVVRFPFAARRDGLPDYAEGERFTGAERGAQVLMLTSKFDHMGLVTSGEVLPLLLAKLTPLRRLGRPPGRTPALLGLRNCFMVRNALKSTVGKSVRHHGPARLVPGTFPVSDDEWP